MAVRFNLSGLASALLDRSRGIAFAAAAVIGAATLFTGGGAAVDRMLASLRDDIRSHAATGEVHIVEIDARSLARIDKWPWPRNVHAAIVDRLIAAKARSIAFDVDFSAPSQAAGDEALAAALARAGGKVILPTLRQQASAGDLDFIDAVPIERLASQAFLAAVNVVPDPDGYVRQMPLGLETDGVPRPSLASMVAERAAKIGTNFDIDYAIEPASIPRHSVIDLIEGRVPASVLAGKRVVIGATAVELGDRYAVPRHGVIPGVVIQALAAETLLEGPLPERWTGLAPLLFALSLLGVAWGLKRREHRIALLLATALAVLSVQLAAIEWFAISLPVAPALLALAAAASLGAATWVGERFRERALTDAASGLANLAAMELATAGREHIRVVVARIDGFETIAAALGPDPTATFVRRVAERLQFACGADAVYRSDETSLAWIDEGAESFDDRAEAVAAIMRSPVECGRLVDASLNLGLAEGRGLEGKRIVANATLAARKAAQGGLRWARFSDADGDQADWQLTLLADLETAMRSGHIWNAYQPKLDLASGRIVEAETLVRWQHPAHGPIGPDAFIPIVESAGRTRDLTLHVLNQAMDDALRWQEEGYAIGVAVNVSAQLLADHEFIELIGQTLRGHPLPAERVTIEVTESAAMANPERAIAALESWRALGVHISIDDYGTGQSSLGYLQKLPASELKIDKSFVQAVSRDRRDAAMVRSTIGLAHELGIKVVAEGVEDAECLRTLAEMGCDKAQGYFIARPMPSDALLELLGERIAAAA